jgi:hypothetical protein
LYILRIKSSKPLKTERTKISAAAPIVTPSKETHEII